VLPQQRALHLLEPVRVIKDERLLRALRFSLKVATYAAARRRGRTMRRAFRKYGRRSAAVVLMAR